MLIRIPQSKKPRKSIVDLAIAALDGNPNVMDLPMRGFDPSPTALDIDCREEAEICSTPCCTRPAADECVLCGRCASDEGYWGILA